MEYNTSRPDLVLPEYGRNVYKLVEYALKVEDKEERNRVAQAVINVMGNMNPHLRDISDFKHKLWDHLAIMSNFKLDIDSPYPLPVIEELNEKPKQMQYNTKKIKYRHFGLTIQLLIEEAIKVEDTEKRNALIKIITNHMKKSYLMWNKDVVADDVIFKALEELSEGKLVPDDNLKLTDSREIMQKSKRRNLGKRRYRSSDK